MLYWTKYEGHTPEIIGSKKKIDNTIYTFDIETTSYFKLNNKIYPAIEYKNISKDEQKDCEFGSCMYEWTFSINDCVFYGRTWEELKKFLNKLELKAPNKKILFIHNLAFEFHYLKSEFNFTDVLARKSHKVMRAMFEDYNFELRCTAQMTSLKLEYLPKMYNLPIKKLKGNLDYSKIRTPKTELTQPELDYCENDCLIIYYYIIEELKTFERVDKIPLTSTRIC